MIFSASAAIRIWILIIISNSVRFLHPGAFLHFPNLHHALFPHLDVETDKKYEQYNCNRVKHCAFQIVRHHQQRIESAMQQQRIEEGLQET